MSNEQLDLQSLQSRINEIKKEGEESADFTIKYIECLIERHDLVHSIPDDYEIADVPDGIIETIRNGDVPTREQILVMDADEQNYLLFELIWLCGMNAIAWYTKDEELDEGDDSTFDIILAMVNVSQGHWTACYLICVMTLLMCQVPTEPMICSITNEYDDSPEQCKKNMDYFLEFASSVLSRHKEDKIYHDE